MSDASTPSTLKGEIDAGATGDKVAASDPSAAPLGTDSEAGGTRATAGEASTTRGLEGQRRAAENTDPARTRSVTSDPLGLPILLALAAAALLGLALWLLLT